MSTRIIRLRFRLALASGVLLLGLTACFSPRAFGPLAHRLADKEVYPIVAGKQQQALGHTIPFTIDPTTTTQTSNVLETAGTSSDMMTTQGLTLNLSDTLALSVSNNWAFQTAKEDVYLSALSLTEARHVFSPIFTGTVTALATRQPGAGNTVERFGSVATNLAVVKLFATGARVSMNLSNNFLRYYTGRATGQRDFATGALSASIVQPLLRGAGATVTLENLRQNERDVIYAVRDFSRYQKGFVIGRITDYYRLLQARDNIDNEYQSFQRLIVARERAEAFEQAGRMAAFEVDQARQDEMNAHNRWIAAQTDYALQLDSFKLNVGLPTDLNVQPDPKDLEGLTQAGLVELGYDLEAAEQLALDHRLDYLNVCQKAEDAARRVKVAENTLLPALDARADLALADLGKNQPLALNWDKRKYDAGLDLELPLDRKAERNAYRRSEIAVNRAGRDAEQKRNDVLAEVRRAFQTTREARQSYDIQQASLKLAERRVDNVRMLLEAGREGVSIRDQLDAESSLRDAHLALTRVLVDYTLARLQFYNAIEALEIDEQGMWNESPKPNS